jgi:hypothetical protein
MNDNSKEFFICDCNSLEHQFVLSYDSEEKEMYMTPYLSSYLPFWKRVVLGIKYIFGYHSKYGHWDCIILNSKEIKRLHVLLGCIVDK